MLNILRNSINVLRKVSGLDSDASAFITAAGLTDPTQKSAINTLVKDMKAAGLWTKMKAVYPMVGGTATSMKFNLKDPRDLDAAFRLTWSGGWTYSATGATPNGTNAYANTNFSPSANLTINSSHLSIYSRTAIGNLPQSDMGSYSTSTTDAFTIAIAYNNTCYMGSYAFSGTNFYVDFTNTDSRGLYINSRTSATLLKGYKNNTIGDTSTNSVAGVLPTLNTIIGAESFNGVPTSYSTKQYAFATMGTGLSDAEAASLYTIIQKYQTSLSRQV
jgi:hypothetical protein